MDWQEMWKTYGKVNDNVYLKTLKGGRHIMLLMEHLVFINQMPVIASLLKWFYQVPSRFSWNTTNGSKV